MPQTMTYKYQDGQQDCHGYIATPDGNTPAPVVLVGHALSGCTDFERQRAEALAENGYIGFAIDIYGDGKNGRSFDEKFALMDVFLRDRTLLLQRATAALTAAQTIARTNGQIAGIGYCFGGLTMLDLARSGARMAGVVSFHGNLSAPPLPPQPIYSKVLALHGGNDPRVPVEQVIAFSEEMSSKNVDWQLYTYGNAMHSFTNPAMNYPDRGMVYHPLTAQRSWHAMLSFLDEIFTAA